MTGSPSDRRTDGNRRPLVAYVLKKEEDSRQGRPTQPEKPQMAAAEGRYVSSDSGVTVTVAVVMKTGWQ